MFRKLSINFRKGHTSVMYRNFKTFNRAKFRNDIYNENWEFLDSGLDPNQMWTEWKTKFLQIVDKHAPIRTKRVKPRPNDRNMPTQHIATLLGATCCVRLTSVLRHVGCCFPNARNMLRPTMLRHVALACCDRLAGALDLKVVRGSLLV